MAKVVTGVVRAGTGVAKAATGMVRAGTEIAAVGMGEITIVTKDAMAVTRAIVFIPWTAPTIRDV